MSTANTPSIFVRSQLPAFILQEKETFVRFLELYFEWLESNENPVAITRKMRVFRDVDTAPEKAYEFIRNEFMANIPKNNLADQATLLKNIKDFYRAKGTEKAYRFLFRILYNEEIDFYYPGKDILRASDGRWQVDKSIKLNLFVQKNSLKENMVLKGANGGIARIEKIDFYYENFIEIAECFISSIEGTFVENEDIFSADETRVAKNVTPGGMLTYPGRYLTTDGFLSSDKYLQDNYYYQEYSYVVKSQQPLEVYKNVVKNTVHTAGTQLFGILQFSSNIDNTGNSVTGLVGDYTNKFIDSEIASSVNITSSWGFSSSDNNEIYQFVTIYSSTRPNVEYSYSYAPSLDSSFLFSPYYTNTIDGDGTGLSPGQKIEVQSSKFIGIVEVATANSTVITTKRHIETANTDIIYSISTQTSTANGAIYSEIQKRQTPTLTLTLLDSENYTDYIDSSVAEYFDLPISDINAKKVFYSPSGTFLTDIAVGDVIELTSNSQFGVVSSVISDHLFSIREPIL